MVLLGNIQGSVYDERFLDPYTVNIKIATFLEVTLYKLVDICQCFLEHG